MLEGSCHCGAARWTFEGDPARATACNCTLCRRYGALWAYDFEGERIRTSGPVSAYVRADEPDPELEILFCPACAGVICWRSLAVDAKGRRRIAVNLRQAEPEAVADIPIRRLDGVDTFAELTGAGRCVRDVWA